MAIASMCFNVYIVIRKFGITLPRIVWLDGHAQGAMDPFWATLLGCFLHVKKLLPNEFLEENVIIVNTIPCQLLEMKVFEITNGARLALPFLDSTNFGISFWNDMAFVDPRRIISSSHS
jgi:hypothetical protein